MEQISIFDGANPLRIDKPIRLVELFGGYGSQALALKYLGIPFEHHALSEWAVKSIQAYKDIHSHDDNSDYSETLSTDEIRGWLLGRISSDYSTPMTEKQIARLTDSSVRKIYNNMIATKNLGSIMAINGPDLNITETDKYCYIMTYSFPCQDLSSAGKGMGMAKGSGTRSGLLWEVERLLKEMDELPQILLMENVPEVIRAKNMPHFAEWVSFLDSLGYKTKTQILNTKHFGVPQNRERCFAVSFLGDYYYDAPQGFPLKYKFKDVLETNVDESYYLKDATIEALIDHKERHEAQGHGFGWKPTDGGGWLTVLKQRADTDPTATLLLSEKGVIEPIALDEQNGYLRADGTVGSITTDGSSPKHNNRVVKPRLVGGFGEKKSNGGTQYYQQDRVYDGDDIAMCHPASITGGSYNYQVDCRIRKLTEKECFRLQGVRDEDFERVKQNQSKSSLYHLAGDSITTSVLMALFGEMLGIDWRSKVDDLAEDLSKERNIKNDTY